MLRIYCTVPTDKTKELASKLGRSVPDTNNLVSVWQSINNSPSTMPTEAQLKELVNNNQKEIEAYKYAIPYYKTGDRTNSKAGYAEIEGNEVVLHQPIKGTLLSEAIQALEELGTPLSNEEKSIISNYTDYYTVLLYQAIDENPDDPHSINRAIQKLREYKKLANQPVNSSNNLARDVEFKIPQEYSRYFISEKPGIYELSKEGELLFATSFNKDKFPKETTKVELYPSIISNGKGGTTTSTYIKISFTSPASGDTIHMIYDGNPRKKEFSVTNDKRQSLSPSSDRYKQVIDTFVPKDIINLVESGRYSELDDTPIEVYPEEDTIMGGIIKKTALEDYFEKNYNVFFKGRNSRTNLKQIKKILANQSTSSTQSNSTSYSEVDSFPDGRLASTKRDKSTGKINITLKKNISVDEFLNYIQGNVQSKTSKQKKLVLDELNKQGITLEDIKRNINTPEKVKQFLYLHELNHSQNYDSDIKNYDRTDMNAKANVDIETRATLYAWEQMFGKSKQSNNASKVEVVQAPSAGTPVEEDLPEVGVPAPLLSSIEVNKESPRAKLVRIMTPQEINTRVNMIAKDFSNFIDDYLEEAINKLEDEITKETDPLNKLKLSEELDILRDPVKGRRRIIEDIGLDTILTGIKDNYKDWTELSDKDIEDIYGKGRASYIKEAYEKVLDNFDLLFDEASPIIEFAENVRIGREDTLNKSTQEESEEEEVLGDNEENSRVHGNEGYTFKIRFVDPLQTIRAETKKVLSNIVQVDIDGTPVTDDLGNTVAIREDYAHASLLGALNWMKNPDDFSVRNSDGTYSLPALERAAEVYPWINQVIEALQEDPNLISIFYTDFRKEYINYYLQRDGKTIPLNTPVAIDSTLKNVQFNYENGYPQDNESIFDLDLKLNKENIEKGIKEVGEIRRELQKPEDLELLADRIMKVLKMLGFSSQNIAAETLKNEGNIDSIQRLIFNIGNVFETAKNLQEGQHYFDSVKESLTNIASIIGKVTELDAKTSFRQDGDTYPSYAAPNYIETLFKNLLDSNEEARNNFIDKEFGRFSWFRNRGVWMNEWIHLIESNENIRDNVAIKNVFNIDDKLYADWTPTTIAKGFMVEYFSIKEDPSHKEQFAWYNFPIFSDTEMATFVKFIKYTGDYKSQLIPLYRKLVKQELKRIRLVEDRAAKGVPPISNFDKNGKKFCFIPELNTTLINYNGESLPLLSIIKRLKASRRLDLIDSYIDKAITQVIDTIANDFITKHRDVLDTPRFIELVADSTRVNESDPKRLEEIINDKVREYVWNQIFATSQIVQLVTTDLAYYKNAVDFQKRFKEVYAAGTKLNTNSKYGRKQERTIYLRDSIVTSPTYIPLKNLFKKAYEEGRISKMDYDSILYKFKNVNAVDGQAYRSLSSYRALMDMLGRWTPKMEEAFKRLSNNEWDISDFNVVWQTIKPFVYGQTAVPDGLGDLMKSPYQHKNSEFLLLATYQVLGTALNNSPQLTGLNEFMEKHNIDVAQFESAVKVGCSGVLDINVSENKVRDYAEEHNIEVENLNVTEAYNKVKEYLDNLLDQNQITQEEYNDQIKDFIPTKKEVINTLEAATLDEVNEDGYNPNTVHTISYDDYMIAQPTPEHLFDVESIFGSQLRNLIYANLPEDIEITIDDKTIKGKDEVQKYWFSLIVENLLDSYKELSKDFSSIEALQKRLLSIVKGNPKYDRDMLNALEIIEVNGRKTFNIPFSDKITSSKMEELLTSIFKNSIAKQYINGAACILASDFGFTDELKIVRREDGSIEAVECFLPAYSKKFYEDFLVPIEEKGKIVGYKIDYNKLKKEDKKLLEAVGYRIPTEGKYSMIPLRIKGFLPQQNGSAIMLPAEITTLSGSDFDVDKLFMMLPEFNKTEVYDINQAWRDFYNDPTNKEVVSEINKNLSFAAKQKGWTEEEFLSALYESGHKKYELSETAQDEFTKWFKNKKDKYFIKYKYEVIKYDHNKDPKDNTRKQRNNELLNIAYQILTNKDIAIESQSPGNFDTLKHQALVNDISSNSYLLSTYISTYGLEKATSKEVANHLLHASLDILKDFMKEVHIERNPLTTDSFIYFHNQNMSGGALIGIYANNNTMQAKFQGKGLFLKDGFEITLSGRTIKYLDSPYTTEDGRQVLISKNCAEFSAASVDNVKDPVLASLMQNKKTANIACFMLRAGFTIPEIGAFFNLPLVRTTIENTGSIYSLSASLERTEQYIADLLGVRNFSVKPIIETSLEEMMENTIELNRFRAEIEAKAATGLTTGTENKNGFTPEEQDKFIKLMSKSMQLTLLFNKIADYSKALNDTVQAYRADSPNGAIQRSVSLATIQRLNVERLKNKAVSELFPIGGITNTLSNDFITPDMSTDEMRSKLLSAKLPMLQAFYSLGIDFGVKKLSEFFVTAGDYVNKLVADIDLNKRGNLKDSEIQTIYDAVIQFALSDTSLFGKDNTMSLEEKRAYYINKFPEDFQEIVKNNKDIASIPIIQKLSKTDRGIIMRDSARNSHYLRDLLMNSMDSLLYLDNPEAQKLAIHLFNYAYFKEGLKYGPNSFSQYFSSIFKTSFPEYIDLMRNIQSTIGVDSRWERFKTQFYANNPKFAYSVAVPQNYMSEDKNTITFPTQEVYNPKLVAPSPFEFISSGDDVYRLNKAASNMEKAQYDKVETVIGGLYDINMDSNDMVNTYKKLNKAYDKLKEESISSTTVEGNPTTGSTNPVNNPNKEQPSLQSVEDFNDDIFDSIEDSLNSITGDDFDSIEDALNSRYSPEEGFKEENIKPCNI